MAAKRTSDAIDGDSEVESGQYEAQAEDILPLDGFVPPSVITSNLLDGSSYTYHSPIPIDISDDISQPCVLGIDEAGRGPVIGPMVYGLAYLPLSQHRSLLAETYHFDDSKVLSPEVRSSLLCQWCTPSTLLHRSAGWAVRLLSARDISAGMLRPKNIIGYNLNQQAMDATISLIQETIDRGVNVAEVYIDTIGKPEIYQKKLERIFPHQKITVATKADSLYPCVSAASVAAKVTRDVALELLWKELHATDAVVTEDINEDSSIHQTKRARTSRKQKAGKKVDSTSHASQGWGSGYPSDSRCKGWLRDSMHSVFGWGFEFRFSWGGAGQDFLERRNEVKVEWPEPDDEGSDSRINRFLVGGPTSSGTLSSAAVVDDADDMLQEHWKGLLNWYGAIQTASV